MEQKLEMNAIFMQSKKMIGCYYMPENSEWTAIKYSYDSEMKEHYTPKEFLTKIADRITYTLNKQKFL